MSSKRAHAARRTASATAPYESISIYSPRLIARLRTTARIVVDHADNTEQRRQLFLVVKECKEHPLGVMKLALEKGREHDKVIETLALFRYLISLSRHDLESMVLKIFPD